MGDDLDAVERKLKIACRRLLALNVAFEHLLLAPGQPRIGGARRAFAERVADG